MTGIDVNVLWAIGQILLTLASGFIGAALQAYRTKLEVGERREQRRDSREVSERDFWEEIGSLKADLKRVSKAAQLLELKLVSLQTEYNVLRANHDSLSNRYDRLRESYDSLLLAGSRFAPEGAEQAPSAVPEEAA